MCLVSREVANLLGYFDGQDLDLPQGLAGCRRSLECGWEGVEDKGWGQPKVRWSPGGFTVSIE